MHTMFNRLAAAAFIGLLATTALLPVRADDKVVTRVVTINEDGFSEKDGFWWKDGLPYTRTRVSTPGGYYRDHYGYLYQGAPSYSWSYTRVALITKTVERRADYKAPPAYGPEWQVEMLKYARARDDYAAYLSALKALGADGSRYEFQQSQTLNLGPYGASGASQYGYSYHQVQAAYGDLNLNALYQQQGRLTQGAQSLAAQAHTEHSQLVQQAGDNQARIAEIVAKAQALRIVADGLNPQPRVITETRIRGSGFGPPGTGKPMVPPKEDDEVPAEQVARWLNDVGVPRCGACHSGTTVKANFDILKYPSMDVMRKRAVVERLVTEDAEKRMPRKGTAESNAVGERIPDEEIRSFGTLQSPKR